MPRVTKVCKACGRVYEACRTPNPGVFRWRDIACSIECAEKYMHDVMVARGEIKEDAPANGTPAHGMAVTARDPGPSEDPDSGESTD